MPAVGLSGGITAGIWSPSLPNLITVDDEGEHAVSLMDQFFEVDDHDASSTIGPEPGPDVAATVAATAALIDAMHRTGMEAIDAGGSEVAHDVADLLNLDSPGGTPDMAVGGAQDAQDGPPAPSGTECPWRPGTMLYSEDGRLWAVVATDEGSYLGEVRQTQGPMTFADVQATHGTLRSLASYQRQAAALDEMVNSLAAAVGAAVVRVPASSKLGAQLMESGLFIQHTHGGRVHVAPRCGQTVRIGSVTIGCQQAPGHPGHCGLPEPVQPAARGCGCPTDTAPADDAR